MIFYRKYSYYSKVDPTKEPISSVETVSRLLAAKYFAGRKNLTLKQFLKLYTVPR